MLPRGSPVQLHSAIAFAEDLPVALKLTDQERQVRLMPLLEVELDPTQRPGDVLVIGDDDSDCEMLEEEIVIAEDEEELAIQVKGEPFSQPPPKLAESASCASSTTVSKPKSAKAKEKAAIERQNQAANLFIQEIFFCSCP